MSKYVTIVDIAQKLGISHSTVSRALNDHPRISQETKKKVNDLAKELGYLSNRAISGFKNGKSGLIATIIPDLSIPYFSIVLENIQKILSESDYSILLFNTRESISLEKKAIKKSLENRVEGIIAAISVETNEDGHYADILKQDLPLVFFDRVINFLPVPKVIVNDYKASYEANEYMIKSGCKRIAHITGTINLNNSNNRLYGYLDALKDNDIDINEDLIFYHEFKNSSIEKFINNILKKYPDLDGLSVFNDYVAYHAIEALENLGLKIPEDVSVFGFSDEPIASYMKPKLSSVEQIAPKIGSLTAQKMISMLSTNEALSDEKIVLSPKLILRETTLKLK